MLGSVGDSAEQICAELRAKKRGSFGHQGSLAEFRLR